MCGTGGIVQERLEGTVTAYEKVLTDADDAKRGRRKDAADVRRHFLSIFVGSRCSPTMSCVVIGAHFHVADRRSEE